MINFIPRLFGWRLAKVIRCRIMTADGLVDTPITRKYVWVRTR